ncbi:hypothetical protein BDV41DRAFT_527966 [Aspergillus transmontanensis]|uniref:Uncharacterized protein n=1 Tax=Aspergillus transmontanensis TaxID=1034304 RepID=A0A5N6W8L8_9EURO|nr:hypothetical protein BDV41DRAFT_527966 [Aspergillus transmontanensis]
MLRTCVPVCDHPRTKDEQIVNTALINNVCEFHVHVSESYERHMPSAVGRVVAGACTLLVKQWTQSAPQ